ncbi:HNH endonuclease [Hymenobacter sp. DG01]|uniref:HNH endonuclease n=1 Tax=Hymenobacter sp. DG01 TaxID=2584940 RepID=UPI00111D457F|nr:HNH endonuclease [Hymenobacter sp. DG01]
MYLLPNVPSITHKGRTFYQIDEAKSYYVSSCGAVYSSLKERCLAVADNGIGYQQVFLKLDNGLDKWRKLHRLVAGRFIPNPENKPDANHLDGNKKNNDVSNLEWVTKSENTRHAYATGLMKAKKGPAHHHYGKSFSAETKAKMSAQKQGENHPKFTGWYVTPLDTFPSARAAAEAMGTYAKQIDRWCKSGKKRAEGYDFIPATSEGQQSALAA